jgi:uncharacterized membrane protein
MNKKEILLKKGVLIAMLIALCFGATRINIPMPTGDMIHLGNFVMILTALLLGGLEGGLVGSLGMGLYDLVFFSNRPFTILRTFILKFIVGFLVGYLFRLILKKKVKTDGLLIASTIFFVLLFGTSLTLFFIGDLSTLSFKTGLVSSVSNFLLSGKTVKVSLYIPIFSILFAVGMILALIYSKKLSIRSKAALFAITVAILTNILGEFIFRWILEGINNVVFLDVADGFTVSLITATSKIPGSLITGFISVILAGLIYEPVYKGVKNLDIFKDNTVDYIDNESETELSETNEYNEEENDINNLDEIVKSNIK